MITETQKRLKGSAVLDAEGLFVFTPYKSGGTEKNMKLIKLCGNAALWKGKKNYSLRLKIPADAVPPLHNVLSAVMELYTEVKNDSNN